MLLVPVICVVLLKIPVVRYPVLGHDKYWVMRKDLFGTVDPIPKNVKVLQGAMVLKKVN